MNKKFEINTIINQIVNLDLQTINGLQQYGYTLDDPTMNKLNQINNFSSVHEIVNTFDEVSNQLKDKQPELAMFFNQFKIRYTYIDTISQSLTASTISHEKEIGQEITWPEGFTSFYIAFFYFQMKKFAEEFLMYINNETYLSTWNSTFATNLLDELNEIIMSRDIINQLELIELWISKYADPEMLFNLIDFNNQENIKEKESFINHFSEFKLALQTLDLIVDLMAKQVKELEGINNEQ